MPQCCATSCNHNLCSLSVSTGGVLEGLCQLVLCCCLRRGVFTCASKSSHAILCTEIRRLFFWLESDTVLRSRFIHVLSILFVFLSVSRRSVKMGPGRRVFVFLRVNLNFETRANKFSRTILCWKCDGSFTAPHLIHCCAQVPFSRVFYVVILQRWSVTWTECMPTSDETPISTRRSFTTRSSCRVSCCGYATR